MTMNLAALFALLAAPGASAFVRVGPLSPARKPSPLHATEAFQRSLLAERLGAGAKGDGGAAPVSVAAAIEEDPREKFQRSLLEAKLANDAIEVALAVGSGFDGDDSQEEEAAPEPKPEPEPEPEPEPVAAVEEGGATKSEVEDGEGTPSALECSPEPELVSEVIANPVDPPRPKRAVTQTKFAVPRELAIVPINEASVQFTAGTIGAISGLVLGGPILGAVGASIFNYLSRKDEGGAGGSGPSAKKVVDTASQTVLQTYNFIAQFEWENKVVNSVLSLLEMGLDKAKESDSPVGDALVTLESALGGITNKVEELNDDYDLVGGAETVLDSVGDLVEIGADKVVELNDDYKLTERVGGVVRGMVDKVTEK